jgi:hypothetical protein
MLAILHLHPFPRFYQNLRINSKKVDVESEKDAKDINELIKLFLVLRDDKMSVDNYNENTLISEKKVGDIEVKAKFVALIGGGSRRKKEGFEFFGFAFKTSTAIPSKSDYLSKLLGDVTYITLIDEDSSIFGGSKLFAIL